MSRHTISVFIYCDMTPESRDSGARAEVHCQPTARQTHVLAERNRQGIIHCWATARQACFVAKEKITRAVRGGHLFGSPGS
jgi:hypothetical protein